MIRPATARLERMQEKYRHLMNSVKGSLDRIEIEQAEQKKLATEPKNPWPGNNDIDNYFNGTDVFN